MELEQEVLGVFEINEHITRMKNSESWRRKNTSPWGQSSKEVTNEKFSDTINEDSETT